MKYTEEHPIKFVSDGFRITTNYWTYNSDPTYTTVGGYVTFDASTNQCTITINYIEGGGQTSRVNS